MKIPHADDAIADLSKLVDYCLNTDHPRGKHKARVFAASLGFTVENAEVLQEILLQAVTTEDAILGEADEYGQRYTLDIQVVTEVGSAMVRSGWMIRAEEDFPRLTTCFVL